MRFYKLTNLTVFAALLKDIPMGCRDAVLPDPLLKNHTVICLTFEQNTRQPYNDNLCLFRALALHLHGNEKLEEETCKLFNLYLEKRGGIEPAPFQGVCMDDILLVEDLIQVNIFLYDIDMWMDQLLVNSHGGVFRSIATLSDYCVTKTTFVTSPISMHNLKPIVVQLVTSFSTKLETWNVTW